MCQRIGGTSGHDALWSLEAVVESDERLAVGVVALHGDIDGVVCIMVATLLVFGLVVDGRSVDFHFTRRPIALEILHIGGSVPKAPFGKREEFEVLHLGTLVGEGKFLHFGPGLERDEKEHRSLYPILRTCDAGIVHAMTALVTIEGSLAWFPAGVPYRAAVVDVEIAATIVHRHAIVAVAGDAAELGILVEIVAACGVGDETEEIFVPEVVDPREWCCRVGDDVFAVGIIEVAKYFSFHC